MQTSIPFKQLFRKIKPGGLNALTVPNVVRCVKDIVAKSDARAGTSARSLQEVLHRKCVWVLNGES